MRIAPPPLFRKDAQELLLDVRARLERRFPGLDASPTDPGWILLEQAAWLAEGLSEQLDAYPMALLRTFLRQSGARLEPAMPALVAVCVQVTETQAVEPERARLFSQQDEDRASLEFVPAESVVLSPLVVLGAGAFLGAELHTGADPAADPSGVRLTRGERSRAFAGQRVVIIVAPSGEGFAERLRAAVETVRAGPVGWLRWEVSDAPKGGVRIVAHLDPGNAFDAPGGVTTRGRAAARWGFLDGSGWRPPVRMGTVEGLPAHLWGTDPLPGLSADALTLEIGEVEAGVEAGDLLELAAVPMPVAACEAVWRTLVAADASLDACSPSIQRRFDAPELGVPSWVQPMLDRGHWSDLAGRDNAVVHVGIGGSGGRLRMALTHARRPRVWGFTRGGAVREIDALLVWSVPMSDEGAAVQLTAWDVATDRDVLSVLVETDQVGGRLLLNPVLCVQAPIVRDGRAITVERPVPEVVSLLNPDVLDADVRERLAMVMDPAGSHLIGALGLARFTAASVGSTRVIADFAGLSVDAAEGSLLLNAPDVSGHTLAFKRNDVLTLDWYRRTDGVLGNVPSDSITLIEGVDGVLTATNPLAAAHGSAREGDDAAVLRLVGQRDGVAVLPAEYEREVRASLPPEEPWVVRVVSYAERTLMRAVLWPSTRPGEAGDPAVLRAARTLKAAGADTLCVLIGLRSRVLTATEIATAERAVEAVRVRLSLRVAAFSSSVVCPWFSLTTRDGTLSDALGRTASDTGATYLNAERA